MKNNTLSRPGFSIIIPTKNSYPLIRYTLRSLKQLFGRYNIPHEIIIVDTGSSDLTVRISREMADRVVIAEGLSPGKARNLGASQANFKYLVFIDSDCIISHQWVKTLVKDNNVIELLSTDYIVVGPSLLVSNYKNKLDHRIKKLLSDRFLTLGSNTFSNKCSSTFVKEAPSLNLLISKKLFLELGGFKDLFYNEDTDFIYRARKKGYEVICLDDLYVIHLKRFGNIKDFIKYMFRYGKGYGIYMSKFKLIRRYAIISLSLPIVLLTVLMIKGPIYIFFLLLAVYMVISLYCLFKYRNVIDALSIPLLFIIMAISYIFGFYVSIIETLLYQK